MPVKSRRRSRRPKAKATFRRRFRPRGVKVNRRSSMLTTSGISDIFTVKMRYSDTITLSSPGLTVGSRIYNGNSIFDPDQTGIGHQPLGRDEWAAFYNKYYVLGSSYRATFVSRSNIQQGQVAVYPKPNSLVSTTMDNAREKPYSKYTILGRIDGGKANVTLKGYMSTKKIFGLNKLSNANDKYSAFQTADPNQLWTWQFYVQGEDEISAYECRLVLDIVYYVRLYDRLALGSS